VRAASVALGVRNRVASPTGLAALLVLMARLKLRDLATATRGNLAALNQPRGPNRFALGSRWRQHREVIR
jgi:hypothetical protein